MNSRVFAFLCGVLFLLVIANLLYIDYKLLYVTDEESKPVTEKITPNIPGETICYADCIEEFSRKIASLEAAIVALPTPKTQVTQTTTTSTENAKEFFIPMGSGTSNTTTWANVPGVSAYIDPRNYNNIKAIYFEVTVDVPTANQMVSVRLFQNNENYAVWNTEMQYTGNSVSQLLISPPITLDAGNKLYTVQMDTQLGNTANISQARVRVVTK